MNNPFQSHHTSRVPHSYGDLEMLYFPTAPNIYSGQRGNQTTTFGRNGKLFDSTLVAILSYEGTG